MKKLSYKVLYDLYFKEGQNNKPYLNLINPTLLKFWLQKINKK